MRRRSVWVVAGFVLVFAYSYRAELRDASDRVLAELMPGRALMRADRSGMRREA